MPTDSEWLREEAQKIEDRKRLKRLEDTLGGVARNGYVTHQTLVKWVAGILGVLIVAGILGGIAINREIGELQSQMKSNSEWIEYLKQEIWRERRRYGGGGQ